MKEFDSKNTAVLTAPIFPVAWYMYETIQTYMNVVVAISSIVLVSYIAYTLYLKYQEHNNMFLNVSFVLYEWYKNDLLILMGIDNSVKYESLGEAALKASIDYII